MQDYRWNKKRTVLFVITVLLLILLEQGIKLAILFWAPEVDVPIIEGFLRFHPVQNVKLSWFGSLGVPFFDNMAFNVVLNLIVLVLGVRIYSWFDRVQQSQSRYVFLVFSLYFAGALCSFIDTVVWGGSLDYIELVGHFIFDLKDCYLNGGNVLMLLGILIFNRQVKAFDDRGMLRYVFTGRLEKKQQN